MNSFHRWYCASDRWARTVRDDLLPWALRDITLGGHVLEIGPGPGLTTRVLQHHVDRLTCVEIDPQLADQLRGRVDSNVHVVTGDATSLPFPDGHFTAAVCFTMLHHVPSPQLQNRLLCEARRVLAPGGVFAGSDSTTGPLFRLAHAFDTMVLVDQQTFHRRLTAAGFVDATVHPGRHAFKFQARRPDADVPG